MKISILMSTYNEKIEYIDRAINSILNQSYRNFEFIIVSDNPNRDDLRNTLEKYENIDGRIKLIFNSVNIGLSASLNRALENATGEYIFRMDADDYSVENRIEKQIDFMKKYNLDFSATLIATMDRDNRILKSQKSEKLYLDKNIREQLKYRDILAHPTWCVKREVFIKLNGYREMVPVEDYDFIYRALAEEIKFGLINEVLLHYRVNNTGISQTNLYKQYISSLIIQKKIRQKLISSIEDIKKEATEYSKLKYNTEEYFELYRDFRKNKNISIKLVIAFFKSDLLRNMLKNDLMIPIIKKIY